MATLGEAVARLEELLSEVESLDEPVRERVLDLLDGVEALHRLGLERLGDALGPEAVENLRDTDPAVAWLFDAYGIGVDHRAAAEKALEEVRPYIHSHGGAVEVLEADNGVVRVKLSGACSGCTASSITLQEGIEDALREHYPGFVAMEVEEDHDAASHPPPGPTLLQIQPLSRDPQSQGIPSEDTTARTSPQAASTAAATSGDNPSPSRSTSAG